MNPIGSGDRLHDAPPEYVRRDQCCPLCPDAQFHYLGRRGGTAHRIAKGMVTSIYQCKACGLIFPNPMPIPVQMSAHYGDVEKYFVEHSVEGKLVAYFEVLNSLEKLVPDRRRLLDVGAGRGDLLKAAKALGWEAVGLEPSPNFARMARALSGAIVIQGHLVERPFEENAFDAVTLGAVLEHVFDPRTLLVEIHRVLRPGGVLWLDVPNEAGLFHLMGNLYHRLHGRDWVVNLSPTFPPYHVFGFTPRALRKLLNTSGFDVIQLKTYATPAVIETQESPVPLHLRALVRWILRVGESLGAGTYMDAWARKR